MKYLTLCLLLFPYTILAQNIVRNGKEDPVSFIRHQTPDHASCVHHIIATNKWIDNTNAVIAFYTYGDSSGYAIDTFETGMGYDKPIVGYLYLSKDNNTFTRILIDSFSANDGALINIESVFFADADSQKGKELAIMVTRYIDKPSYHGIIYDTYFYRQPDIKSASEKCILLKDISKKFSGGCDCINMFGKIRYAKYRSADVIKATLRK